MVTIVAVLHYNARMSNIERPPVSIETIPEVYDFYRDNQINERFANLAHRTFGRVFQSQISLWHPDAEHQLQEDLDCGAQVVLAANHLNAYDQYVVAALPTQLDCFGTALVGNTFIPAKINLFQKDPLRWAVEQLGGIPAFRGKDFRNVPEEEVAGLRTDATDRLIATSVNRMDRGQHMAIFPEGTRNAEEPDRVQTLRRGIGEIACATSASDKLLILPIGMRYGQVLPADSNLPRAAKKIRSELYDLNNARRAYLHIGEPLRGPFGTPEEVCDALRPALQDSLDKAIEFQQAA